MEYKINNIHKKLLQNYLISFGKTYTIVFKKYYIYNRHL